MRVLVRKNKLFHAETRRAPGIQNDGGAEVFTPRPPHLRVR